MAQVIFTGGLITSIRGKVGDLIFRQTPSGKTIVYKAPKRKYRQPSELEKKNRHRFIQIAKIVKLLWDDPYERSAYIKKFYSNPNMPSYQAYLWKKVHKMLAK